MIYTERIKKFSSELKEAEKKYGYISIARLFAFITAAFGIFLVFYFKLAFPGWGIASAGLVLFIILVIMHIRIGEQKLHLQILCTINKDSLARTNGEWVHFSDSGDEYSDPDHPYSRDLDIFGSGSLFQLINVTNTPSGRMLLKSILEKPYQTTHDITQRQAAVTELAGKLEWRQRFQAEGMRFSKEKSSILPADFAHKERLFKNRKMIFFIRLSPVMLICSAAAAAIFDFFPSVIPMIQALVHMIILRVYYKRTNSIIGRLLRYREMIKVYKGLIGLIEGEKFSSVYLAGIAKELKNQKGKTASSAVQRIETITDIISMRGSALHFPVNVFAMIDLQYIISFERWCDESGVLFDQWVGAIAKMEIIASLSLLKYDNPGWCLPVINDAADSFTISATGIAHPLIEANSTVSNDFSSDKKGRINIVTGSNMSGKSTFLRTIALNLVLAYAGAPVNALRMECSLMKIYTSMRIIDNIGKHISSFYAELLRIKMIIDGSKQKEKIFFALDELFRGTNSRDRILGARAVIKSLSREHVTGMISTHDLVLTELANDPELEIVNYHFRESYGGNDILFDYKLYDGVSTTSDALYLMKKAGIEV